MIDCSEEGDSLVYLVFSFEVLGYLLENAEKVEKIRTN